MISFMKCYHLIAGTIVTLNFPSEHDESLDNAADTSIKEESAEVKNVAQGSESKNPNSDKVVKIKRTRSNKFSKLDTSISSDAENSSTGKSSPKIIQSGESGATTTRSRKASVVSQDSCPNVESDKTKSPTRSTNDDVKTAMKRRYSQRCSSTSESKSDSSSKTDSNKVEIKRKSVSRR